MRFRNYRNRFSRRNRIYSEEDLLKMTLESIFDNEPEIIAQNTDLGIPTYSELESSPNTEWITNPESKEGYWQSILPKEQAPILSENVEQNLYNNPFINLKDKKNEYNNGFNITNDTPLLEGGLEKNVIDWDSLYTVFKQAIPNLDEIIGNIQNVSRKYEGLNMAEKLQKAASKLPIDLIEREYYGYSTKSKDGDPIEDKFKEENDVYRYQDITDSEKSKYYKEQLAKMYGLDVNSPDIEDQLKDKKIVVPKETSRLYQYAKNSEALGKWIAENYDKIKKGEKPLKDWVEFPSDNLLDKKDRGLFATLHKMNVGNAKVNHDGSLSFDLKDLYNFEHWKEKMGGKNPAENIENMVENKYVRINNRAYEQQQANQLEPYAIYMPVTMSQEELKKILMRYLKNYIK